MVFGQVLPHEPAAARFTHRDVIRKQMEQVDRLPGVKMVSTDGFGLLADTVHYNAEGQLSLGREFAKALKTLGKAKPVGQVSSLFPARNPSIVNNTIPAFFSAHCLKCHNADKHKSGINVAKLTDFRLEFD